MSSKAKRLWQILISLGIILEAVGLLIGLLAALSDVLQLGPDLRHFGNFQTGVTIAGVLILVVGMQLVVIGAIFLSRPEQP